MMLTASRPSYVSTEIIDPCFFGLVRYFSGYFRYRSTFFGVLMATIPRRLYRISPEVSDKRCGENDEEYIEGIDSATTDITGAINLAPYGIVNCKRVI